MGLCVQLLQHNALIAALEHLLPHLFSRHHRITMHHKQLNVSLMGLCDHSLQHAAMVDHLRKANRRRKQ
jgi:hypothetical protein